MLDMCVSDANVGHLLLFCELFKAFAEASAYRGVSSVRPCNIAHK